ncbi:fructose-2,6-bisphosphatase TIGAR B [Folsomia candida]|uniref:fructose-2,6-bisphosphatase TIGAR B n=1 Tax=Folsomia candida TaxID=158441 RepID=UPI000B8EEC5C|nr:fructose-2,6-bisphosphatase TIGAR B [Folsomia candida]XP_021943996.1 fructose-2,6-bisphosphatase TIGAR B [Folsomia candida]
MFVATFVRHGETKLNAAKIIQSRTHGELSEKGILMAEHLGRHLTHERFTRVYTSDLQRCHDTTLNILKHSSHPHPELVLEKNLRERDYGDLEFKPTQAIYDICSETGLDTHAVPLPGGEPYEETKKRTAKFLNMLGKLADASSEPEHALVVTHGAWLMCMMDYLADSRNTHYDIEEFQDKWLKNGPPNTATTRFLIHPFKNGNANEKSKRKLQIVHVYDTTHLPEHFKN